MPKKSLSQQQRKRLTDQTAAKAKLSRSEYLDEKTFPQGPELRWFTTDHGGSVYYDRFTGVIEAVSV